MIYKASKCEWPWIWPLKVTQDLWRSLKVKYDDVIGLSLYAFLLMFNSNIWPNSAPLQYIYIRASKSEWPWIWPFKVTRRMWWCHWTCHTWFPLDIFSRPPLIRTPLLPKNSVLFREVSFGEREHHMHSQNLLPKIVSIIEGCPLREGPLYSNQMSNSHHLALITTQNVFSYLLSLGPSYGKSQVQIAIISELNARISFKF